MNELESKLLQLIEKGEQLTPELIDQYLHWQAQVMFLGLSVGLCMLICLPFTWKLVFYFDDKDNEVLSITFIVLTIIFAVFGIVLPVGCGWEYYMITNAPDIYIIQTLMK